MPEYLQEKFFHDEQEKEQAEAERSHASGPLPRGYVCPNSPDDAELGTGLSSDAVGSEVAVELMSYPLAYGDLVPPRGCAWVVGR